MPDTGVRLRGMIEKVFAFAQSEGHIDEDRVNPAISSRLKDRLPDPDKLAKRLGHRRNHAAMPYADVPEFAAKLKGASELAVNALMLAIFTAARSVEVIGAAWDEIDLDAKRWAVPAERRKMGAEHIVPLADAAIDLLRDKSAARRPKQARVFPGARPHVAAQRPSACWMSAAVSLASWPPNWWVRLERSSVSIGQGTSRRRSLARRRRGACPRNVSFREGGSRRYGLRPTSGRSMRSSAAPAG
jgi:integrase